MQLLSNVTDHGKAVHFWANMLYIVYLQSYFKRPENHHKQNKMVLIYDTATSPEISFSFYIYY